MVPTRRAVLASGATAVAGALTGCVDSSRSILGDTRTPPDVATPAPGACDAVGPPTPPDREGLPAPLSYPEPPDTFTMSTVREFLPKYERVFIHNRELLDAIDGDDCLERLTIEVTETSVARAGNGFNGAIKTYGSSTGQPCPDVSGTDTPTPLPHSDFIGETDYYLTDRFLVRAGTTVECW